MIPQRQIDRKPKWLELKNWVAGFLIAKPVGRALQLFYGGAIPFRGTRILVPERNGSLPAALLFWNIYESAEIRFIHEFLDARYDVIELGSSLGATSCQIAKILNGRKRLICVEANPLMIPMLRTNLRRNSPDQPVSIVNAAVGPAGAGRIVFGVDDNNLVSRITASDAGSDIESLTLSDLLQREGISEYALVCDIEGAEVLLLRDEPEAMAKCRLIIIETHDFNDGEQSYDIEDVIALALKLPNFELAARYGCVCVFRSLGQG